jgi:hypothetical protein
MDLEWSEGHLERFYNLRENYSEHFDEERAKEIAKWLKDHQEEVYLDKLLEEGLSHEEAWEIASKTTYSGVTIEELTEAQLKRYQELREDFFSEADAIVQVIKLTPEQQRQYSLFLGDGFGPDDAWGMALNYEAEEDEEEDEDDEQPIPDGYSGEGFLETLEEIQYELREVKSGRGLCSRYMQNSPEKQERLSDLDKRIAQLEHLLKNFENTDCADTRL